MAMATRADEQHSSSGAITKANVKAASAAGGRLQAVHGCVVMYSLSYMHEYMHTCGARRLDVWAHLMGTSEQSACSTNGPRRRWAGASTTPSQVQFRTHTYSMQAG